MRIEIRFAEDFCLYSVNSIHGHLEDIIEQSPTHPSSLMMENKWYSFAETLPASATPSRCNIGLAFKMSNQPNHPM